MVAKTGRIVAPNKTQKAIFLCQGDFPTWSARLTVTYAQALINHEPAKPLNKDARNHRSQADTSIEGELPDSDASTLFV